MFAGGVARNLCLKNLLEDPSGKSAKIPEDPQMEGAYGTAIIAQDSINRSEDKVVVYFNSNLLGIGEEALGSILMKSLLKTLTDMETIPSRLTFINSGVRLASDEHLQKGLPHIEQTVS